MTNAPNVVMFMSVDIVGSTTFKSHFPSGADEPGWLQPFQDFFQKTPLRFIGRLAQAFSGRSQIPESSVWRVRGDEIIFMSPLSDLEDVYWLSIAFLDTVADCRDQILGDWGLEVRGCCWAAHLSGRNRSVVIPEMYRGFLDYLGPDVDTGFRLASCAAPGDVAFSYNLIRSLSELGAHPRLKFRYAEDRVLKGVAKQIGYPIVTARAVTDSNGDLYQEDARGVVDRIIANHPKVDELEETLLPFQAG